MEHGEIGLPLASGGSGPSLDALERDRHVHGKLCREIQGRRRAFVRGESSIQP